MFALTNQGGNLTALAPDVCKVPSPAGPVPTPFPNMAVCSMVTPSSACTKVMVSGGLALTVKSKTMLSNGDEAGTLMGVVSNKIMGEVAFVQGSMKVRLEGKAAVRNADPTTHNANNTTGIAASPTQTKVMVS